MFQVVDWAGEAADFDRNRLELWGRRALGLRRGHARFVAREVAARFAGAGTVQPQQLVAAATRLSVQSLYCAVTPPARAVLPAAAPGGVAAAMVPVDPGTVIDAAKGIVEFVGGLIASGWREEPGKGFVREEGSPFLLFDDARAPSFGEITQVGQASCCQDRKGVMLTIRLGVTDDGGGGNDSGVKRVKLFTVTEQGVRGALGGESTWTLDATDSDMTESVEVFHTFEICVPCAFIRDRIADIWIEAEDDDENARIVRLAFSVEDVFDKCCGAGG